MSTISKDLYANIVFNLETEAMVGIGKAGVYSVDRRKPADPRAEWDPTRWRVWNLYAKAWRWFNLEMSIVARDLEIITEYKNKAFHLQSYHSSLKKLEGDIATVSDKLWNITGQIEEIDQTRKYVATQNQNVKIAAIFACLFGGLYAWSPTYLASLASQAVLGILSTFIYFNWTTGKETPHETWQSIGVDLEKVRRCLSFYNEEMQVLPGASGEPVETGEPFKDFVEANYEPKLPLDEELKAVTYVLLPSPPETQSSTQTGS